MTLRKDKQSYQWLLLYLEHLDEGKEPCLALDNLIQCQAIKAYLREKGKKIDDNQAIYFWVNNYSADFRAYLNSLKMAAMMLLSRGIDHKNLLWDDYCNTEDLVNRLKNVCLDGIF